MAPLTLITFWNDLHLQLLGTLLLCSVCQYTLGRRDDDLIVSTEKGRVRGIRYNINIGGRKQASVHCFLGIPFAKPPLGHLRFRHPQPIDPWQGIYNATKLPNTCYQLPDEVFGDHRGSTMWNPNTKVSEDCLYLSVWVPRTRRRLRKSAVLVWIYGGGFWSGSTTLNVYDAKILAAMNEIIVVSIAYRVGVLGFLALGHSAAPGNAGMFDQLMGLEWIQQNIRHFGGDPDNVTIFGESAGSVSVSLHLFSPLSSSKFDRAIMQSGTANMPWGTYTMTEGKRRGIDLAYELLDCPVGDIEKTVECLRNKGPQELIDVQWISQGIMQFPFLPVIDGAFLTEDPIKSLEKGRFKKCPVLLGSNLNEGNFFLIYELSEYLDLNSTSMTYEQFQESTKKLFYFYPQFPESINDFGRQAILYQYTNWIEPNNKQANLKALDSATSDCHFVCNVNYFAHKYAIAGESVYAYHFTQRFAVHPWPEWMGVLHGDEIMMVFGEPFKPEYNSTYTEAERALSKKMMQYWTNFAKIGDPNIAPGRLRLDDWPPHTPNGKEFLELHSRFLNNADKSIAVGKGLRSRECAFWREYLPNLVESTRDLPPEPEPPSVPPVQNISCENALSSDDATSIQLPRTVLLVILLANLLNV